MIPRYAGPRPWPTPPPRRTDLTTPEPVYAPPVPPRLVKAPAVPDRRARIRAAAHKATQQYPGPIGELVKRELEAADEFAQAIDAHGLTMRVVDHILKGAS